MDLESLWLQAVANDPPRVLATRLAAALRAGPDISVELPLPRPHGPLPEELTMDPALAGNLLRLAHAPFFRTEGPVLTLEAAADRVGPQEVHRLLLGEALSPRLAELAAKAQRHTRAGVLIAAQLAPAFGVDAAEARAAAVLRDVGVTAGLAALGRLLRSFPEVPTRALAACWARVEASHVELGQRVLRGWGLPEVFAGVVASHHRARQPLSALERCVATAERLAERLGRGAPLSPSLVTEALAGLEAAPPTRTVFQALVPLDLDDAVPLPPEPVGAPVFTPTPPPVQLRADLFGAGPGAQQLPLLWLGERAFAVVCPSTLKRDAFVGVQLHAEPAMRFWAVVDAASPVEGGFELTLVPRGLPARLEAQWKGLVVRSGVPLRPPMRQGA